MSFGTQSVMFDTDTFLGKPKKLPKTGYIYLDIGRGASSGSIFIGAGGIAKLKEIIASVEALEREENAKDELNEG